MRRLQTDPKIIMDIISCDDHPYLFNMIIANIGNGSAINIKFDILNEPDIKKSKKLSEYMFIRNGISFLSGGGKFKTFFLSTIDEDMEFVNEKYDVEIKYEDVKGRKYAEKVLFDFSYLPDITIAHTDPLYKISKNVNELSDSLKIISRSIKNIAERNK
jgi:hypothetical protein